MEITPLTQEQLVELSELKKQNPDFYKQIFDLFQANVKAYRKYNIYGIGTDFSKDVWQLARYFEYKIMKKSCTPVNSI